MGQKEKKKWLVVYFKGGEVATPVWEVESAIKPTRWAKYTFPQGKGDMWDGMTFHIAEVDEFDEAGYKDSYLKALFAEEVA